MSWIDEARRRQAAAAGTTTMPRLTPAEQRAKIQSTVRSIHSRGAEKLYAPKKPEGAA